MQNFVHPRRSPSPRQQLAAKRQCAELRIRWQVGCAGCGLPIGSYRIAAINADGVVARSATATRRIGLAFDPAGRSDDIAMNIAARRPGLLDQLNCNRCWTGFASVSR
jgi:hypothetical protein